MFDEKNRITKVNHYNAYISKTNINAPKVNNIDLSKVDFSTFKDPKSINNINRSSIHEKKLTFKDKSSLALTGMTATITAGTLYSCIATWILSASKMTSTPVKLSMGLLVLGASVSIGLRIYQAVIDKKNKLLNIQNSEFASTQKSSLSKALFFGSYRWANFALFSFAVLETVMGNKSSGQKMIEVLAYGTSALGNLGSGLQDCIESGNKKIREISDKSKSYAKSILLNYGLWWCIADPTISIIDSKVRNSFLNGPFQNENSSITVGIILGIAGIVVGGIFPMLSNKNKKFDNGLINSATVLSTAQLSVSAVGNLLLGSDKVIFTALSLYAVTNLCLMYDKFKQGKQLIEEKNQ